MPKANKQKTNEAKDADSEGESTKTSAQTNKNKNANKKKSQKKGTRDNERMENFRAKTSERSAKENREALFEKLFFGFTNVTEAMKNIQLQQTDRTIIVPVSTRAAGLIICGMISKFARLGLLQNDEAREISGALYRITLLQINYKLEEAMVAQHSRNLDLGSYEDVFVTGSVRRALAQMGAHFSPLVNYISSIGFIRTSGCNYLPRLPKVHSLSANYLSISNLRETVVSLSNNLMTPESKRAFMEKSPLPNAIWNCSTARRTHEGAELPAACSLANPDEVMPENYSLDDIKEDIQTIAAAVEKVGRKYPKYVTTGGIDWKGAGSISQLVSCGSADVRCPSFVNQGRIRYVAGEHTFFWSPEALSDPEAYMGVVYLLGEVHKPSLIEPECANFRTVQSAKREINLDFSTVLQNLLN